MMEIFELKSTYNTIRGVMTLPDGKGTFPCVILSHGLVSSKDSSKYIALSDALLKQNIATCRFDYHGCGESSGKIEETTLTIRLENLSAVIDFVINHKSIDKARLGILGSSFGGATAIIKAARDRRIKCISFLATPYKLEKKEDGDVSGIKFKDEIYKDFSQYHILSEAEKVSCGLGIHGDQDEVVPYEEGLEIFKHIKEPKRFELIKGADHVFSDPVHRQKVIELSVGWFMDFFFK
ncbi:MAG: alpha/beta fold hydrolase [Syntrophorhabdaceae bacterium]|nr:alpha/beta fold hydrolase [Syntrophorhabdaceae bacterium]